MLWHLRKLKWMKYLRLMCNFNGAYISGVPNHGFVILLACLLKGRAFLLFHVSDRSSGFILIFDLFK